MNEYTPLIIAFLALRIVYHYGCQIYSKRISTTLNDEEKLKFFNFNQYSGSITNRTIISILLHMPAFGLLLATLLLLSLSLWIVLLIFVASFMLHAVMSYFIHRNYYQKLVAFGFSAQRAKQLSTVSAVSAAVSQGTVLFAIAGFLLITHHVI